MDIQKLKELAQAATHGPWISGDDEDSDYFLVGPNDGDRIVYQPVVKLHSEANADYIAAANPQTILALLDELEKEKASRIAAQNEVIELKDAVLKAESTASRVPLLLTELESLRSERTAWRVTAENAEKQLEEIEARAAVPAGWKLLKDTTQEERSWTEDMPHENGYYMNTCVDCGRMFTGHKRRVVCKSCAAAPQPVAQPSEPETTERQIAEALRVAGLTLVKKQGGYSVIELSQITAQAKPEQAAQPMTDDRAAHDYFGRPDVALHPESRTIPGGNFACFLAGVRFAERHHGITASPKPKD